MNNEKCNNCGRKYKDHRAGDLACPVVVGVWLENTKWSSEYREDKKDKKVKKKILRFPGKPLGHVRLKWK